MLATFRNRQTMNSFVCDMTAQMFSILAFSEYCSPVIVHPWIFFLDAYHLFIVYCLLVNECFLFYLDITVCPYRNIFLWLGKTCIKHKCLFICAVYSYHNTNIAIFYKMYSTSPLWCFMSLLFIFDFYLVHT